MFHKTKNKNNKKSHPDVVSGFRNFAFLILIFAFGVNHPDVVSGHHNFDF